MKPSKIVILVVLLAFLAFTAWVVAVGGGFAEAWTAFTATPWSMQIGTDLVLALSMVCFWIWQDARSRGRSPLPWLLATFLTGSIAPLTYLLLRDDDAGA